MPFLLPPNCPAAETALKGVAERDREDAVQEAWVAYLEGGDPAKAIETFARQERRHRKMMRTGIPIDDISKAR